MYRGQQRHERTLEVWVMDEHRLGLQPITRRIWALRGQRPVVRIYPRYEWLYVYAFAHPNTGRSFYLLMPTVSIPAFTIALQHFAAFIGLDNTRQILVLLDNAGWHTSPKVSCPPQLELRFLPAYSPQLQPAEHLWHLTDQPLVNRCFDTLDDLEQVLAEQCRWLQTQLEVVRSTTHFHWWPAFV